MISFIDEHRSVLGVEPICRLSIGVVTGPHIGFQKGPLPLVA